MLMLYFMEPELVPRRWTISEERVYLNIIFVVIAMEVNEKFYKLFTIVNYQTIWLNVFLYL